MPTARTLVPIAASGPAAQAILGTVANAQTATGNSQGTALLLPADITRFTTVAASTGCIIPPSNPGDQMTVYNGGANALSLYPPTGGTINGLGANSAYSIATATPYCDILCITPLIYIANQSA